MRQGHTTHDLNLDVKSQLAKLIATENVTVQHNNVKTASFDTQQRVLTLPIFKVKSGDVYDMLIAHECAHALWTPKKAWAKLSDPGFRAYVNVLEDCRIDAKIKKRYPGIVKNYMNAFEILDAQDFFGLTPLGDLNKNLMFIDKINLYFKSTFRKQFIFTPQDRKIIKRVKELKTFKDVYKLAEELYGKAKKEMEKLKKLPDFDDHPLAMNYDQAEPKEEEGNEDGKVPTPMEGDKKQDSEEEEDSINQPTKEEAEEKKKEEEKKTAQAQVGNPGGRGGDNVAVNKAPPPLKAITQDNFDERKENLVDKETTFRYCTFPDVNLNNIITSYKSFFKTMSTNNHKYVGGGNTEYTSYYNWLKDTFKKFKKDNQKTVMYLVKEFEMKKSASAYKRASVDKTGIIDPLKLRDYKFSEDIFKRLTILPNDKNHGLMMLLDWSGSMSDVISKTVHQLCNLVWFCEKVQIPFEVYMFNDCKRGDNYSWLSKKDSLKLAKKESLFNYKDGDMCLSYFNMVNIMSHRMRRKELETSCFYMFQLAESFDNRYNYRRYRRGVLQPEPHPGMSIPIPDDYYLSSTPLNESLIACMKLIPLFKKKYNIEKMTFITLTDGGSNGMNYSNIGYPKDEKTGKVSKTLDMVSVDGNKVIVKDGKKLWYEDRSDDYYYSYTDDVTTIILNMIRKKCGVKTVGFYILKDLRRWSFDRFVPEYETRNGKMIKVRDRMKVRKQFLKDKALAITKKGYNEYYLLNGKSMDVQQVDLSSLKEDAKKGDIKRTFAKSMSNRIHSRVILNRFIDQVA